MTIFNNIHDKNSQKNRKRGKLQLDKGHLPKKPRPNILVKNCLPLKIRNKASLPTHITLFQHSTGSSSQCSKTRKGNKRYIHRSETNCTCLQITWLHRKSQEIYKNNNFSRTSELSKVTGYEISIQKPTVYTNNEQ